MLPTSLKPGELSALTALGQMSRPTRKGDAALILDSLEGVAREVASLLLDDPSGAEASEEARHIAWAIQNWVNDNRQRAAARGPRVAAAR